MNAKTLSSLFKRLAQVILILLGITFVSFALMRAAGSDAITEKYTNIGITVSEEILNAEREKLGLNQPFFSQYLSWLANALRGDFGVSYVSGKNVLSTLISRLPATLMLTFCSLLLTLLFSLPAGFLSALYHRRIPDQVIRVFSFIGNSLPLFLLALLLIQLFSVRLNWLPVVSLRTDPRGIILPALSLAIVMSAKYTRQIRTAVLEELNKEYVTGALARGVPMRTILLKSVLKSTMLTILTLMALSIGSLLGGTAVIETIFMWDGVGRLAVEAIQMRDYPVIQAYVVWMALIYMLINFAADALYRFADPRIRLGGDSRDK